LILDSKKYALKYALIYTVIIAVVLFVPLFVYTELMLEIDEAKVKKELKESAFKVISKMEEYDSSQRVFIYPRYEDFVSGLYDKNFNPVFTLLDFTPQSFSSGYHTLEGIRYYIVKLPEDLYFGAKYLVVAKRYSPWDIYLLSFFISGGIIAILLLFSFYVLKNFSKPFEKINEALDNFIKDSMHEINTPLSIINVNIDMFVRKAGSNRYLSRIKSATKTLANIYNDMDYLIKQDKIEYKKEKIDFSQFLKQRVDYFQEIATLRNITLIPKIEENIVIDFNKTKLQRLVDNTLSNAIKYSKENSKVKIYLKKREEKTVFNVKDYGVGIENPKKIFERFYRENLDKGGFGIGLNIVKKIIDEENVKLKIISKPHVGSSFIYYF